MLSFVYSVRLVFVLFLLPLIYSQATGPEATVSIVGFPPYPTQAAQVRSCLWDEEDDLAHTLDCASPTNNACYCPTGLVQQASVLSCLTGCMTYWYDNVAALDITSAVSVYQAYCSGAVGLEGRFIL